MALVVFLRGVNVGGHRTFRPAVLARQLGHLDVVNVGAAGTLVVRRPVTRTALRAELARRLPFDAEAAICEGREILGALARSPFAAQRARADQVRFVSILLRRPRAAPPMPARLPSSGTWLVKILAAENRFVFGVYRRHMQTIGYLGKLDRVCGGPVTTRNMNTMDAVARLLATARRPG